MPKLRIAMAQLNLLVGDISGNLSKHIDAANRARDELNADIIVFPELSLTGYAAEDLFSRKAFLHAAQAALQELTQQVRGIYCLVGHPALTKGKLYNACSLIFDGKILCTYHKQRLPNYGVFDEYRYFTPGHNTAVIAIKGVKTGILICEDLWRVHPAKMAKAAGAELLLVPNASPFEADKHEQRVNLLANRARSNQLSIVYVNHISGQDDLIFDGGSLTMNPQGELCAFAGFFNETLHLVEIDTRKAATKILPAIPTAVARIYDALVLSVRDYVQKNGFKSILVGSSGGIDSALTLTIATDALGEDKVHAIMMPSRYSADISMEDAKELAKRLKIKAEIISIEACFKTFLETLAPLFQDKAPDLTEQNIQARCRGMLLMALSNKWGHLVLTTGNRSEMAVGYCTLYGDMAGGFAVLKDIPKTLVYALAHHRNQHGAVIPDRILTRAPTAELAPNQTDQDSLPPYEILDQILFWYLNEGCSAKEIISKGLDEKTVHEVIRLVRLNEYKRKQAATGPHINHTSFTRDWRYPVTNGFKE